MGDNLYISKLLFLAVLLVCLRPTVGFGAQRMKVIFDTDISSDVDDVGAVAVLHALASQGKVDILAMMISSGDPWSAPCIDALNTWYGRPDIPIGMIKDAYVTHESKYTQEIASIYPHDLKIAENAPGAVQLYRQVLSNQPDSSVIIVTVGYLSNLANLLQSGRDASSILNGSELVRKKVKYLISMGGDYPRGKEWNFFQDVNATHFVLENWPTRVFFVGYSLGLKVLTGESQRHASESSPVRLAYKLYNGIEGRPSWDQLAVLYAGEDHQGRTEVFETSDGGINSVSSDGSNHWRKTESGYHHYVSLKQDGRRLADKINELMLSR